MYEGPGVFGEDPFRGNGKQVLIFPNVIVWEGAMDDGTPVFCRQERTGALFEANARMLNDSADKRWGDGQIVGSWDMGTYFKYILPAVKAGDDKWIRRHLNDSDNRRFKTFRGSI